MKTTIDAPRLSRYDGTTRAAKPDERLPVSDDWGVPALRLAIHQTDLVQHFQVAPRGVAVDPVEVD